MAKDNTGLKLAVQALREMKPEAVNKFGMWLLARSCGTPACVLGHLAARQDLQQVFRLQGNFLMRGDSAEGADIDECLYVDDPVIQRFFDITGPEANLLFDTDGCNGAETPEEAIEYLETFIAARERCQTTPD